MKIIVIIIVIIIIIIIIINCTNNLIRVSGFVGAGL